MVLHTLDELAHGNYGPPFSRSGWGLALPWFFFF